MPIDCTRSNVQLHSSGRLIICLGDTDGTPFFGADNNGTFASGSSTYDRVYASNAQIDLTTYENPNGTGAEFQCYHISYTPPTDSSITTDSLTLQEAQGGVLVGNPCTFNFSLNNSTGNAPQCPTNSPDLTFDINTSTGTLTFDILTDYNFSANCIVTSVSEQSAAFTPVIQGNNTTVTIGSGAVNAAGVGTYTINYTVDCGANGTVNCSTNLIVTDTGAALSCPNTTPSFNYDLNIQTSGLTLNGSQVGFDNTCTFSNPSANNGLTVTTANGGANLQLTDANLTAAGLGSYTLNYTVTCGGESVNCQSQITIVDSGNGNTCIDCSGININWNGVDIAQGTTQILDCATNPTVQIVLDIPYLGEALSYGVDAGGLASFDFVSTTLVQGGRQVQTWELTTSPAICGQTLDINVLWSPQGPQSGCPDCDLFSVTFLGEATGDNCIDCSQVGVSWNGVPVALGSQQQAPCTNQPVDLAVSFPVPTNNANYFILSGNTGTFAFDSTFVNNGIQTQVWTFTPDVNNCGASFDLEMVWNTGGAQDGCENCSLFNLTTGECSSLAGACTINTSSISPGQEFILTLVDGCNCAGCTVQWFNAATNPTTITLTNDTGRSVINTFPQNAVEGDYSFIPACCGCDE